MDYVCNKLFGSDFGLVFKFDEFFGKYLFFILDLLFEKELYDEYLLIMGMFVYFYCLLFKMDLVDIMIFFLCIVYVW